jgi:hypothetical protein
MKKKHQKILSNEVFKKFALATLLLSFFFVALHTSMHNVHADTHDSSCSVYVLEQLFAAPDLAQSSWLLFLFTPYIFLLFTPTLISVKNEKHFAIRAPPSF